MWIKGGYNGRAAIDLPKNLNKAIEDKIVLAEFMGNVITKVRDLFT